ncbi:hypothetical protein IAQ61_002691 [Plenodomus lingam]|uniref:Similar to cyclin domain-containing protein n=1 Tax=Leptosphaeria maculans (strain JN3 / isolate v23.1.3 / race Av1-4-5-6-7-8) TaxID=985895 RepID=E5A917_LEPMJ|nr:similar to cyclin domain-containing protein [Plenodomus lingam JN3]KAH9877327.1 hypothetical protein IAQ61_002691 [Plenodomus lingam]CBY00112.1 similar to cyclin domain-containing protein [Plenodomus lingam JN3]
MQPSPLANPMATIAQLETSGSQLDGIPIDLEDSIRFAGARLTQAAGQLLRLPQEVIAQAIVIFMRFWVGPEGGSLAEFGAEDVSMASLYLITKLSAYPKSARSLINVYAYLAYLPSTYINLNHLRQKPDPTSYYVSEGTYERTRTMLFATEHRILRTLGFQIQVALPYTLCITYLQALDVFSHPRASDLAKRAIAHLNTALLSPQLLYLTHQPPALATAAIYLAAREIGVKMPECEWWEVFDADREQLGFLCVGMLSLEGFAQQEKSKWGGKKVPMTVRGVEAEVKRRQEDD